MASTYLRYDISPSESYCDVHINELIIEISCHNSILNFTFQFHSLIISSQEIEDERENEEENKNDDDREILLLIL